MSGDREKIIHIIPESTFQELFKYKIRFSKYLAVGYWRLKNVTVKVYLPIFGPFFPFFGEMRIFPKNSVILYPLMPSNFMQNIKKI